MEEEKIQIPEQVWPAGFPESRKDQWRRDYESAMERSAADTADESVQRQSALKEANRLLRMPKLTSYGQAMKLEDWQVIKRAVESVEGAEPVLKVVTIDGAKYTFTVPMAREEKTADASKAQGGKASDAGKN